MNNGVIIFLSGLTGLALGIIVMIVISKAGLNKDQQKANLMLKEAESKADSMVKQAVLDGRTQAHELKIAAEKEIKERKQEVTDMENKLLRREDNLNFRDETLTSKEKQIDVKNAQLADKMAMLDKKDKELQAKIDVQVQELERVAAMTTAEAKEELFAITEKRMEKELVSYIKEKEEEAKATADEKARNIVALSIQRLSNDEAIERTVSVVALPSEEMKGRIIGREGRNIKAIEQATGVDLIIDDTPETITVSCFDPIRREVARLALEHLIKDGRIQPGRIEEVVNKIKREMDTNIMKTGEDTVFKLGIGKIDREIVKMIGRLKYRYSYGQNALQHSMEVAHLSGMMAAELGLNQQLAKRAGLLHDIGKAMDFEVEGSHIELGYKFCKKHGEKEVVLNAIQSHHGEVEPEFLISNLVIAADTLSAARPGARYESLQNYINRLEELEKITKSFDGVESSYAIQAGREVRVMAIPEKMDDIACHKLARDIKDKIEAELTYPGQIKVTVIRETRSCELAK
ncbi:MULTISPECIES: ribonuclease Y [Bacillota]|uniref:Ribonuclease Y n=2 Tax=Amedibacillus TaxID=2749846 RepID=A0A7G9GLK5_9FIRM|nr:MULTISPECIES: ribonuclease Y [Bacillota]QNM11687.1 ribonuclease Y [[Eubacterium] hominis]MCH4285064.1 ribonuclease Y [Amedibacillus hominis]RGB56094.1 ribonuclease Y [Absiella sp. AM22-9]RGB61855.1 ribonuclease Y [Absiella sp. AM10-20]RGB70322.1 ribonuclease Y [Absiella sp. AM09-45]